MLSEIQKSAARFDGGKPLANYRSHIRRVRGSLFSVRTQANAADSSTLWQACLVLDRLLADFESDINESKRIKRDWDKRVADATQALQALPLCGVADVIALAELDHGLGRPHALIEDIKFYGWQYVANNLRREAIAGLASRCASEAKPTAEFITAMRAAMPASAARHADLIGQINTLAVAQTLERAARQPAGGL